MKNIVGSSYASRVIRSGALLAFLAIFASSCGNDDAPPSGDSGSGVPVPDANRDVAFDGSDAAAAAPLSALVCEVAERPGPIPQPPTTMVADFGPPTRLSLNDPCPQDAIEVTPLGNRIYHVYAVNNLDLLVAEGRQFDGVEIRYQDRDSGDSWLPPRVLDLKASLPGSLPGETRVAPDGSWVIWHALGPQNLGYVEGLPSGQTFDLDLYEAPIVDGKPGAAEHLPSGVNSIYLDGEHWATADGRTLYVASNRPGGQGGLDIWRVSRDGSDVWSTPEPLGVPVNSPSDEIQPTLSPDGQWLYFASDRDGAIGIWRVPVQAGAFGTEAELVITPYVGEPSFADDGRLFFVHVEVDFEVTPPDKYDADIYVVEPVR